MGLITASHWVVVLIVSRLQMEPSTKLKKHLSCHHHYPNLSIHYAGSNLVSATCWGSFTWLTQPLQWMHLVLNMTTPRSPQMVVLVVFWVHKCFSLGSSWLCTICHEASHASMIMWMHMPFSENQSSTSKSLKTHSDNLKYKHSWYLGFIRASLWGLSWLCLAFTSKHSVELRDAFVKLTTLTWALTCLVQM